MLDFYEPRSLSGDKRFVCTILDRGTAGFRVLTGVKRFRYVMEDLLLGIRSITEADTYEEARQLSNNEWLNTKN